MSFGRDLDVDVIHRGSEVPLGADAPLDSQGKPSIFKALCDVLRVGLTLLLGLELPEYSLRGFPWKEATTNDVMGVARSDSVAMAVNPYRTESAEPSCIFKIIEV